MKLLIVSNMYPSKEKSFAGIFVKNQYEVLRDTLAAENVDIFYMRRKFTSKLGSLIKYINAFFNFFKVLFKKYDVVHLHYLYPLIYLVAIYKFIHPKVKIVVTYHGSDITKKITPKNRGTLKKLTKIIDYHIPVGKALSEILYAKLNIEYDKILPVGVNDKVFYYENVNKIYDYVYVGSLIHRKGVDIIIEAIGKIPHEISVCFVGQGDYLDKIEQLTKEKPNVTLFTGLDQNEIQKILVKSKFLLLPSRNEGYPTSTIEAMFCGVPVIVSDIPQTSEQVVENKNGFIIPSESSEHLSSKMISLAKISEKEYLEIVQTTLSFYKEISLTKVCSELINIYEELNIDG